MPLLLTLAIIVVALVVLVLLYLTFVPIVASFSAAACLVVAELVWGFVGLRARVDPTGGIGRLEIRIAGLPIALPRPKRAVLKSPAEVVSKAVAPEARVRTVLEAAEVLLRALPEIMRLLVAVLRETRLRLRLRLIFGTGDAATTGETFGALMALRGAVSGQPWLSLTATPVFDGPVFDWHAAGEARIRSPIRVLLPSLRLFLRVRSLMQENGVRS
jgi:hypothetical protein